MATSVVNQHQPSMTEWFAAIGEIGESNDFREEDNRKAERLDLLHKEIGLPYREPVIFPAVDLINKTPVFLKILESRADESICLRLTSKDITLPKLRSRGLNLKDCYEQWFLPLEIDFEKYTASIFPNETEISWSMTFVINDEAIFGEIIAGTHNQLSQGETKTELSHFRYDYKNWEWSSHSPEAQAEVGHTLATLLVPDKNIQVKLVQALSTTFSHDYLTGYFEATSPKNDGVYFIDYNRVLPRFITTPPHIITTSTPGLSGMPACAGVGEGTIVIVTEDSLATDTVFPEGSVLVCDNTDVRYLPFMQKAAAIVTNRGGMLSHAAIIARELKKPCVIGTKTGTTELKNGDRVRVDADAGTITILN
jgi:phosphohistidine swiveling domain-containing protein